MKGSAFFGAWTSMADNIQQLQERIAELEAKIKVLERDLIHDALTGLKTRAFFEEEAHDYFQVPAAEHERRKKIGPKDISIIFFDLDHFKQVNDTYGHPAGDVVLKSVAETIRTGLRKRDTVARWGGEEIIALLPGANESVAAKKAESIRRHVSALQFSDTPELHVTISAGVATAESGLELKEVVSRADKALYRAKEGGRDRVEVFSNGGVA